MKNCKKIISSVLVFALMGVPVVSGAFAAKTEPNEVKIEEQLSDQQLEKTETNLDKTKNEENNKKGCQLWKKVKNFLSSEKVKDFFYLSKILTFSKIFTLGPAFTLLYKFNSDFREYANSPFLPNEYGPSKRPFLWDNKKVYALIDMLSTFFISGCYSFQSLEVPFEKVFMDNMTLGPLLWIAITLYKAM